jgi:hypothetical protein
MKISSLKEILKGKFIVEPAADAEFTGAHTSDLLSDVMANASENLALITIQAHKNTVAVCSLLNLPVVIVCSNRPVAQDMIDSATEEGVSIFVTDDNQFEVSVKLGKVL